MKVYVLTHTHQIYADFDDVKFIGVYESVVEANGALERSSLLPGFKDCKGGFHIEPYEIGKDHWTEGYVTLLPGES